MTEEGCESKPPASEGKASGKRLYMQHPSCKGMIQTIYVHIHCFSSLALCFVSARAGDASK